MALTSTAGLLSLLEDTSSEVRTFALHKLLDSGLQSGLDLTDVFWPEVSDRIDVIEKLYEDEHFQGRFKAALVASKVYFHLGSYEDALLFALSSGSEFDELLSSAPSSEFVSTIVSKCIDSYIARRRGLSGGNMSNALIKREEALVNNLLEESITQGQLKEALGVAIEAKRMDVFRRAILAASDRDALLSYALRVSLTLVKNRTYRLELLSALISLYRELEKPDLVQMCQCLIFRDDADDVAHLLETLSKGTENDQLMAYQIAFDMYESATQQFLNKVIQALMATAPLLGEDNEDSQVKEVKEEEKETDAEEKVDVEMKESTAAATATKTKKSLSPEEKKRMETLDKLTEILSGNKTIYLHLQFLMRNDHSDPLILKQTKDAVRVSICHTATVIANGLMHCGTTHDAFLRDNLEWLGRATNWAKLSATASLGVIHRGHETDSTALMQSYLPKDATNSSGYAEGGGLFALGLIHANHGTLITDYLLDQLKEGANEPVRHGGCLGLGLAAMGSQNMEAYEQLKSNLYEDDAIIGEAAGMAMGLVQLGSNSASVLEDLVSYAQETQHEKIIRGLAVGIALVMYGRLEEADALIETLSKDKDALLRRAAMYTIAMAYCGTGSNKAIRQLLHVAVSDVNDDVRRAAVTSLGFLLFKTPDNCPGVVSLLSESFNPHVRYGAAMALGIACAGTGSKEAMALLEPLANDPVNYVRQGALIASALVLIQHTEATSSKVKEFRALYAKTIADKHDDVMAKFGAILAQGIIDAGGRNMTVCLHSRTGHTNVQAVVGMLVFCQYWYWFPLTHFLSLAFVPSALIGLNANLDMPVVSFRSNAKPSVFAYPQPLEERKKEDREKVATAVLSITAKQKKKESERRRGGSTAVSSLSSSNVERMDVDTKKDEESKESSGKVDKNSEESSTKTTNANGTAAVVLNKTYDVLSNPARVITPQLRVMQMEDEGKYEALKDVSVGGIIMMRRLTNEPCEIVEPVSVKKSNDSKEDNDDGAKEPEPPQPFIYTGEE